MTNNPNYIGEIPEEFYSFDEGATDLEKVAIRESYKTLVFLTKKFITFKATSPFYVLYKTGEIELLQSGYTSATVKDLLESGNEYLTVIASPGSCEIRLTNLGITELQSNFDYATSKIAESTNEIVPYLPALVDALALANENNWINLTAMKTSLENQLYYLEKLVDSSIPDRIVEYEMVVDNTASESALTIRKNFLDIVLDWCYKNVTTIPLLLVKQSFSSSQIDLMSDDWWNDYTVDFCNGLLPDGFSIILTANSDNSVFEVVASSVKLRYWKWIGGRIVVSMIFYLMSPFSNIEIKAEFDATTGLFYYSSAMYQIYGETSVHAIKKIVLSRN
jgi:hypothetical protein